MQLTLGEPLRDRVKEGKARVVKNGGKGTYRKTSDSSRVPYTSRAPDTGRGLK